MNKRVAHNRLTNEEFKKRFKKSEAKNHLELLGKYGSSQKEKIKCKCLHCGRIIEMLPQNILKNTNGCKPCAQEKHLVYEVPFLSHEQYVAKLESRNSLAYPVEKYNGYTTAIQHKCKKCGCDFKRSPGVVLKYVHGCPVCAGRIIVKGVNDLNTLMPEIAKWLLNPEDGYKYGCWSKAKIDWICDCGNIIYDRKIVNTVKAYSLGCSKCNDGISYPNRLMREAINSLGINHIAEATFSWSGNKRYDIFIENLNGKSIIIEVDGKQHYDAGFERLKGVSLHEQQAIDKHKEEMAMKNGIDLYYHIDCRESSLDFIRNSSIHSLANSVINFEKVDWNSCHRNALKSKVIEACELWNAGSTSTTEIAKKLGISSSAIWRYLKKGAQIGLCNYNADEVSKNILTQLKKKSEKQCKCITTNEVFVSRMEASRQYDVEFKNISACCRGKRKHAGSHPVTGEKLAWEFFIEEAS